MRKRWTLFGMVLAGAILAGCGGTSRETGDPENEAREMQAEYGGVAAEAERIQDSYDICGMIRGMDDGTVTLDVVEFITPADTERLAELGLTEADLPNGYYLYNADESTEEYPLSEDVEYSFIDWGRDFVDEGTEDIRVSTKDGAAFEEYLKPYLEIGSKVPFFFKLDGEQVNSITEEALTSM